MTETRRTTLMDEQAVRRAVARMSREILERHGGTDGLTLMGIHRRGVHLAALLREEIQRAEDVEVPMGTLDITMYRDDLMAVGPLPVVGESALPPGGIDDRCVVVVDDVLYTGRTVRAALNEIMDWGRPSRILLCVLVDRGGRELPIQADVVGREFSVLEDQRIDVHVPSLDDQLAVVLGVRRSQ